MSSKISILDEKLLKDCLNDLQTIEDQLLNVLSPFQVKILKEKLFFAKNWLSYSLEIKKIEFKPTQTQDVYNTKQELILKLRMIVVALRTMKRTNAINNAVKYIIETIFILKGI